MPANDTEEKTEAASVETRILDANFAIVDIPDGNDRYHPRTRSRDRFFSVMNRSASPAAIVRPEMNARMGMTANGTGRAQGILDPGPGASLRRQHHHHLAAFHGGLRLDFGDAERLGPDTVEQTIADVLMGHLATAEP